MSGEVEKQRIEELVQLLAFHSDLYYNKAKPEISDADFDLLQNELETLDPANSQLNKVGSDPSPGSEKVDHEFPMLSLGKATSEQELSHFVHETTSGGLRFISQPKLDGSALSIEYRLGRLVRAATRGNGLRGEDVTLNARQIMNIPESLNVEIDVHVRGEVVMPLAVFNEKYQHISPNPRNLAAGALRQKHREQGKAKASDLVFFAYDVQFPSLEIRHPDGLNPPRIDSDSELIEWLTNAGITPAECNEIKGEDTQTVAELLCTETTLWKEKRDEYEYEIDGVVFKLDSLEEREELGMTAHHPRWALAWKFPPEIAETVLLDVSWQTGRTGTITPVGKVAPQKVGGVTVENVTLHNPGEVQRLGISVGDKVRLVRRGDVIPKIESVLGMATESNLLNRTYADGTPFIGTLPSHQSIITPTSCPSCDGKVVMEGAFLRCIDIKCIARLSRSLIYWCRTLEMDGVGEKLIEQLIESELVSNISDLYKLESGRLSKLDRMAQKSAENVCREISKTTILPFSKFLHALGLPGIGPELANSIANEFKTIEEALSFVTTNSDDIENNRLVELEGIGETVALQFIEGINDRMDVIHSIMEHVTIIEEISSTLIGHLGGKKFCITGTLSRQRKEIENMIKKAGGKVVTSVSKNLDYLISGNSSGSKLNKAVGFGVTVLSENDFDELIEEKVNTSKTLFDY